MQALRRLWAEAKFSTKNVVIGMGSQQVLIRELVVPKMSAGARARDPAVPRAGPPAAAGRGRRARLLPRSRRSQPTGSRRCAGCSSRRPASRCSPTRWRPRPPGCTRSTSTSSRSPSAARRRRRSAAGTEVLLHIGAVSTSIIVAEAGVPQFIRVLPSGGAGADRRARRAAGRRARPRGGGQAPRTASCPTPATPSPRSWPGSTARAPTSSSRPSAPPSPSTGTPRGRRRQRRRALRRRRAAARLRRGPRRRRRRAGHLEQRHRALHDRQPRRRGAPASPPDPPPPSHSA